MAAHALLASSAKLYVLQCWQRCAPSGNLRYRFPRPALARDITSPACPQRPGLRNAPSFQHVGYGQELVRRSPTGSKMNVTRRGMIFGGRKSGSKPDSEEFYPAEALRESPAEGPVDKLRK